ncbi:MAG: sigma-70 family RNA polymerase sigma factor [Planctomycetota bacterium]|jgi:RNA polymerase sigma-70 factor (ECF subfamily)
MLDDRLVVWKLKRGDSESLRHLYVKYKDQLLLIGTCLLNESEAAEEILHDVFVSFAEGAGQFHLYGSLKNYLISCVVEQVRDKFRERMYKIVGLDSTGPILSGPEVEEEGVMDSEESQIVAEALVEVGEQQRNAIILHLVGGMKFGEIGRMQNVSASTAEGRYCYGLDTLRKLLDSRTKLTGKIEETVRSLRCSTTAETDEQILNDALSALGESTEPRGTGLLKVCEVIMTSRVTLFGTAVLIIAVLTGFILYAGLSQKEESQIVRATEAPKVKRAVEAGKRVHPIRRVETRRTAAELKADLKQIEDMYLDGDVDGLVDALYEYEMAKKLAAAVYLGKIGDASAIDALEELSVEYGDGNAENPFARAIKQIERRLEEEERAGVDEVGRTAASKVGDKGEYIQCRLVDENGKAVRGEVILGGVRIATAEDGGFTLNRQKYAGKGKVFGQAFSSEGDLGCLFIWGENYDAKNAEILVMPPANVSGFVLDGEDNAVSDFDLEISALDKNGKVYGGDIGEAPWQTEIEGNGVFAIFSIPMGLEVQLAVKKGEFETTINLEGLAAGGNLALGRITLEEVSGTGTIARWDSMLGGLVVNENGEAMGGVRVTVSAGERTFEATSDAGGRYELQGLPEGVQIEVGAYLDGYGYNRFGYRCAGLSNELDIQIFPPAYDWYGKGAPGLIVKEWVNGEPFTLGDFAGRVVLLQVGIDIEGYPQQTEAPAYLRDLEQIKDIIERYGDSGLAVIGVHKYTDTLEREDDIRRFLGEYEINFPFCIDEAADFVRRMMPPEERYREEGRIGVPRRGLRSEGAMYSVYEVKAQPAYYLIDKDGILRISPAASELEGWLVQLLAE